MRALVFGEADPKDYMEPLCVCGHDRSEHYDGQGHLPDPSGPVAEGEMAPCWGDWHDDEEGCQCLEWRAVA